MDARLQGAQEEVGVVDARRDHDRAARQQLLVLAAVRVRLQVRQVPVRAVLLPDKSRISRGRASCHNACTLNRELDVLNPKLCELR